MACFFHVSTQHRWKYPVILLYFTWSDHCYHTESNRAFRFVFNDFPYCSVCSARPSLIEYLSYNLNFLSVLVGPCSNYKDYTDFIEGRHISRRLRQHSGTCNGQNGYDKTLEPSPLVSSSVTAQSSGCTCHWDLSCHIRRCIMRQSTMSLLCSAGLSENVTNLMLNSNINMKWWVQENPHNTLYSAINRLFIIKRSCNLSCFQKSL